MIVRINASAIRSGNTILINNALCIVLKAENIQPGKGTPVTQLQIRRISDGTKFTERFRTTEQIERCYVEDVKCHYLYQEGDIYIFMHGDTFDQIPVHHNLIATQAPYLQENMEVTLRMYEENAISAELPARAVLEVIETEPALKGQTATSSYKPALLSNGIKIGVPVYITAGTFVIVDTKTNEFLGKDKD